MVDQNRITGAARQIKGKVKSAFGKATGDQNLQAEGKIDQGVGKVQQVFGKTKDKLRGGLK